MFIIIDVVTA